MVPDFSIYVLCFAAYLIVATAVFIYYYNRRLTIGAEDFLYEDIYWSDVRKYVRYTPVDKLRRIRRRMVFLEMLLHLVFGALFMYSFATADVWYLVLSLLIYIAGTYLIYLYLVSVLRVEYVKRKYV